MFISYARVDKPYCIQIAETLDIHKVWYDQRLYAGQEWWKEIKRRLEWCEGFVYLLSPESVTSEYCQKEFRIALKSGKHIFPVLIHEDTVMPDELQGIHYADFSDGITLEGVKTLLNSIHVSERGQNGISPAGELVIDEDDEKPPQPAVDIIDTVIKAADAMENGKYDEAVFLLEQVQNSPDKPRFTDLAVLLREARVALERQAYVREADREYKPIVELVIRKATRKLGCEFFGAYSRTFPDHDPENLAEICGSQVTITRQPPKSDFTLPMLEWCEVPEGELLTTNNGNSAYMVGRFYVSKYPVTNLQFDEFINDPEGYDNPQWWAFSAEAAQWKEDNPKPKPQRFKGETRPRENVTWYESMAFCGWLTHKTGLNITLPTTKQWQRAATGGDGRLFPWGNDFDPEMANTRESKIRMTTLVMRYEDSLSPFGVYDMAGNVWEWCVNPGPKDSRGQEGEGVRAIHGGSFISGNDRSQTDFHFNLNPAYFYATIGFRIVAEAI
jgi:formylglycine-generating enzyme required for sulfatase activity